MDIKLHRLAPAVAVVLGLAACGDTGTQETGQDMGQDVNSLGQDAGEGLGSLGEGAQDMGQQTQDSLGMDQGEQATAGSSIPVQEIMQSPNDWAGRTVDGQVQVTELVGDRGFWVESNGQRLFILLDEGGQAPNLQAGQTVQVNQATVREGDYLQSMQDLDPQVQTAASGQEVFLTVDSQNIQQVG